MSHVFRTHRLPLAPNQVPAPTSAAVEMLPTRRGFLQGLAASMALAGMAGCSKRPKETIVPYVSQPEQLVPGEPLFFATTLTLGGYGRGVIVTTREGRPIKIEGNPDHPSSLGAADPFMQAAVLDLYDPARSKLVTRGGEASTWGSFVEALRTQMRQPNAGAGLRILTSNIGSPTELRLIDAVRQKFPGAQWHAYDPVDRLNTRTGAALAFGRDAEPIYHFGAADVIVAVDSDFLNDEPGSLAYARAFASRRRPAAGTAKMNRLYAVESTFSITGTKADHRLAVRPAGGGALVFALAAAIGVGPTTAFPDPVFLDAVVSDLKSSAGRSLVIVGERQAPEVHAAAHRINQSLGNFGHTIDLIAPVVRGVGSGAKSLADLTFDMRAGQVMTLLILGGNPARTAPAGVPFAAELARLSTATRDDGSLRNLVAHLGPYADETAFNCQWHVPAQHTLESWTDARAHDGTASIVQPLIAPLFDGHSAIDILCALVGNDGRSDYEIVRETWRDVLGTAFQAEWTKSLQRGTLKEESETKTSIPTSPSSVETAHKAQAKLGLGLEALSTAPSQDTLDIIFVSDASVHDGCFFHNAWLQELPRPLTKICWGNAALVSPATATRFQIADGDVITLESVDKTIEIPALALPGLPDGVITLHLGYGKHLLTNNPHNPSGGLGGDTFGVDVYPIRSNPHTLPAVTIQKTGRNEKIVRTHNHHAMASHKSDDGSVSAALTPVVIATPEMPEADLKLHNRKIIRTATAAQFAKTPDFAQRMEEKNILSLYTPWDYSSGPQWAMTIDLSTCIGCNACTIACQAENNIPVVGPESVDREREMHWIRIDSYFGEGEKVYHQPVPCMHCENAPCEYVCPVAATSHSKDGLNQMTYNRCVGTRYCSNNCPYKVRRFNFFNYTADLPAEVQLRNNPDVTVRTLGVMEKCTYCVQRIAYTKRKSEIASLETKLKHGDDAAKQVYDDSLDRMQTACQQTCPTQSITFGNLTNAKSEISAAKGNPRNYGLLTELTTKPRTTYLAHVSNPNVALGETSGGRA